MTTAVGSKQSRPTVDGALSIGRARTRRANRQYFSLNGATIVTIAALALSAIGILYLMQTSHVADLGYQIAHLQQRHDELALETSRLGYEVARHESLETVEQVAMQELGMTKLQNYQFIEVQQPIIENLPPPTPEIATEPSLWKRIANAFWGVGQAHAPTEPPPAVIESEPGEERP